MKIRVVEKFDLDAFGRPVDGTIEFAKTDNGLKNYNNLMPF